MSSPRRKAIVPLPSQPIPERTRPVGTGYGRINAILSPEQRDVRSPARAASARASLPRSNDTRIPGGPGVQEAGSVSADIRFYAVEVTRGTDLRRHSKLLIFSGLWSIGTGSPSRRASGATSGTRRARVLQFRVGDRPDAVDFLRAGRRRGHEGHGGDEIRQHECRGKPERPDAGMALRPACVDAGQLCHRRRSPHSPVVGWQSRSWLAGAPGHRSGSQRSSKRLGVVCPPPRGAAPNQAAAVTGRPARRRPPLHVVADVPTAVALLGRLDEVEGLIVTTVSDEQPAWVPERLRDMVLTPADAKGLEVRIDLRWRAWRRRPGRWGFTRRRRGGSTSPRTAIDQLRVALNRGHRDAAFVDVAGRRRRRCAERGAARGRRALRRRRPSRAPLRRRATGRTSAGVDARHAGVARRGPGRTWQRACQVMRLLGDPQVPNGVSDESVRIEPRTTLLATAARLLVTVVRTRGPP